LTLLNPFGNNAHGNWHQLSGKNLQKACNAGLAGLSKSFLEVRFFMSQGLVNIKPTARVATFLFVLVCAVSALAQDVPRQTVAIAYPLDEQITVKFRGTTLLPRLKGEAKIKRSSRRGTRVELSIDNMPRASELGGIYTTYVVWAISPEGVVDNIGEIKRSGNSIIDSKLEATTTLQTFALIVTAEPHFLVKIPSRMVVLENLPPNYPSGAQIETANVKYLGNSSDYFKNPGVPDIADRDYRDTPVALLGARQAVKLARYAGADQDAPDELKQAETQLAEAETAWHTKLAASELDVIARKATAAGAHAEEIAMSRRAARLRREDIRRRDEAVRTAEQSAANANQRIEQLRAELAKEQRARELAERDVSTANDQSRDLRIENSRLRDELQRVRAEGDSAKLKLARLEGARQAEEARREAERHDQERRAAEASLRQNLLQFGTVRDTPRGFQLVLPDTIWAGMRAQKLTAAGAAKLEPLAALLASNPDYQLQIEAYSDSKGDEISLQQFTQERARTLAERLQAAGVDSARIQASGMGAANPVAPNTTLSGRAKNRRIEITFLPVNGRNTAAN
jgi:outer membrane protein OmpA-like peptidoglycan-associated protein